MTESNGDSLDPMRPVYAVRYRRDSGAVVAVASTIASDTEHLETSDVAVLVLDEAPPWPFHVNTVAAQIVHGELDQRPIEQVRAERWEAIKAQRERLHDEQIVVPSQAFSLDADAPSRLDLLGAIAAMQASGDSSRRWRCADNVMRELTLADLLAVGGAIAARRQTLIEISDGLYQQIQAAQTAAQVLAVMWPPPT
jgi:hypothetical protein